MTKTSKGGQPFNKPSVTVLQQAPAPHFKKPSLDMARSYNAFPASQSTVNTSFNTVSSSQQTQPDTANTSFTSDGDHTEVTNFFVPRTSSTTVGSLDDQDLLSVGAKLVKEAASSDRRAEPSNSSSQGRDSSSTWGSSIPEEDLLEASDRVESFRASSPVGSRRLSPTRPAQQTRQPQQARSLTEHGTIGSSIPNATSFNQSFPPPLGVSASLSPDKSRIEPRSPSDSVTPAKSRQRSSREQTPNESPSKVAHNIRDIPLQGLFVCEPPLCLQAMPFFALFICQRIALERSVSLSELTDNMDIATVCADPEAFWSSLLEHPKITHVKYKDSDRLWSAKRNLENFTFKGQINLRSKRSGPIFQLDLHPILPDKSCRFQRKFGSDRFLYLNVPEFDIKNWGGGTQDDLKLVRERWDEWLHMEHKFLSRKWRVFHVEPMKNAKTKGRNAEVTHRFRIVLFATEGRGISRKYTVGEMLNWFLPFEQNMDQSFCKAYARYDLGLSRTTPTYVFKPSQIIRVRDVRADGKREATDFDDPRLKWATIPDRKVMNDGCCVMSVGAALEIWKHFKKFWGVSGPLPSAFQGRIGGAKGLWTLSAESFTKDPEHLSIWIRINDSQLKFDPHPEDHTDAFDRLRLTFEVSNHSSAPAHSELHISFIPIMADRGVPRDVIADYMSELLDADRNELLERVCDPIKLYEYVHRNSSTSRDGSEMPWQAAMPMLLEEKIKLLLESGFSPLHLQVLAKHVSRFVKKQHLLQESKLKTPLGKATYLYGVADPLGILEPGEVHVQFSSSFVDDVTDEKYLSLKGHELLVARQPAIRQSDIQKVRAVCHPDLSHLVDVVVFPSRGQFPLAGKLQGGDYDGDIFWLCWEEKLVEPFKNAPAPVQNPDPEQYGIKVDRRTLKDLSVDVNNTASIDDFLREAFVFRLAPSLLGIVTNHFEKQSYQENRLSSFRLDHISNMHDLLVDAAKSGYTFTMADWRFYLRSELKCSVNLKQPIYKDAMKACATVKDTGDVDKTREKKYKYKRENIIDYLYFEIVRSHNVETMKQLQTALSSATEADPNLLYPRQQLNDLHDPVIDEELRKVQEEMYQLYLSWNASMHKDDRTAAKEFARVVDDLYTRFTAVKPSKTDHPTIKMWLTPFLTPGSCLWDKIRASVLYARLPSLNAQTFVFQMAGDELAKIKADNFPRTRSIIADIRANMKPKPIRIPIGDDDMDEDDDVSSILEQ